MPTNLSDVSLLSRVTLERFVGIFFPKIFFRLSNRIFSLTSVPCLQICLLCFYLVVSHHRFVGTFFSEQFSDFRTEYFHENRDLKPLSRTFHPKSLYVPDKLYP